MITRIQKKFALSRQGAVDLIKGCSNTTIPSSFKNTLHF